MAATDWRDRTENSAPTLLLAERADRARTARSNLRIAVPEPLDGRGRSRPIAGRTLRRTSQLTLRGGVVLGAGQCVAPGGARRLCRIPPPLRSARRRTDPPLPQSRVDRKTSADPDRTGLGRSGTRAPAGGSRRGRGLDGCVP